MLIIIIIIIVIIALLIYYNKSRIYINDIEYFAKINLINNIYSIQNNNMITNPENKKNKILVVSFDNRTNPQFIKEHNKNLIKYTNRWDHEYQFYNICKYNVYWCKIFLVYEQLLTNKYDYVMWLDSDTCIKNMNIDLNDVVNKYSSDIFIGDDNAPPLYLLNAGVFIIKNSAIGKQFLEDCIKSFDTKNCLNKDNSLSGIWGATCYEQGVMNLLILNKYSKYSTMLPKNIIYNGKVCDANAFIVHLYGSSDIDRTNCFKD